MPHGIILPQRLPPSHSLVIRQLTWHHIEWRHMVWRHMVWRHTEWCHIKWRYLEWRHIEWCHIEWRQMEWRQMEWRHIKWRHLWASPYFSFSLGSMAPKLRPRLNLNPDAAVAGFWPEPEKSWYLLTGGHACPIKHFTFIKYILLSKLRPML